MVYVKIIRNVRLKRESDHIKVFVYCDYHKYTKLTYAIQLFSALHSSHICIEQRNKRIMKNLIILPILLLIVNITFSQSLNDNEGQRNNKDIIDVESTAPVPEEISKDEIDSPVIINSFNKKSNKKTRTIFSFKQKTKQKYSSKSISKKRTKMSKKNKVRVAFIAGGLLASLLLGVLLYALGIIVVLGLLVIYLAIWPAW